ncbi:MAG: VOC family protein [Maribacter sp.]|uniref:VOC family protein n=1 Tax=Maribacter sp. TaxID=1897614 RepID=UPI0032970BE0
MFSYSFDHVAIQVVNMGKALDWYRNILGGTDEEEKYASLKHGASRLEFIGDCVTPHIKLIVKRPFFS